MNRILLLCLALLPLSSVAEPPLEISAAWVRALPPTQPNTAAYLTLRNGGERELVVVGASADVAGRVEVHHTRQVDGLMRMEQLQRLPVAPGATVKLEPGGAHLMLLDLQRMPAPGDEVRLCLQLASAEEVCTVAAAHKSGPAGHHHH
ncbi:MAG: copper chaperone PCu(A)C [Halioglobus sp.]|nr:copper chaperone PCu(A)C [Halioglobus sp.]